MRYRAASLYLLTGTWAAISGIASAQTTAANSSKEAALVLEEIIVTAQKREQKISDVGIFIQTANAEQLASSGVDAITELPKMVPGMVTARTIGGYEIFSLRGVNFNSTQISAAPTVSTYVDEAALPYGSMTAGLFLDVERLEILKGPQGTLFGQNATGGSINVIAAKPTREFAAGLEQSFNEFGESDTKGFVSGPLSDTLRGRLAFSTTHGGAWQEGYFANDNENGDADRSVARVLLDWTPADTLKVSLNLNGNYSRGEGQSFQLAKIAPQFSSGALPEYLNYPYPPKDNRASDINSSQDQDHWMYQGVLRIDYDVSDTVTLTSITNYIENQHDQWLDNDSTTIDVSSAEHFAEAKSIGQEIRLTGTIPDANVHWIVGGNYQKDDFFEQDTVLLTNYSALPGVTLDTHFDESNRSEAVFASLDWDVRPGWTLTTGVRYTEAKQTENGCTGDTGDGTLRAFLGAVSNALRGVQGLPSTDEHATSECNTMNTVPDESGGLISFLPTRVDVQQQEDNVAWRVGVNYKPSPDGLLYAFVARGYKAGVFPFQDTIAVTQVKPVRQEELTDYEIGFKFDLLDSRLNLEGSAFYYEYVDKQFFTYVTLPFIGQAPTLTNIPDSELRGVDLLFTALPLPGLTVRGGVTYVETEVGEYQGINVLNQPVDFTGKEFNFAPPWSGSVDAEYRYPLAGGTEVYVGTSAWFNSKTYGDLANSRESTVPGFTIYDARVGFSAPSGWRGSLWVRNLTDKYYWTSLGVASDNLFKYTGLPRTYGVTLAYSF